MEDSRQPRARAGAQGRDLAFAILDAGDFPDAASQCRRAIQSILQGKVRELARDRNSTCYRVRLSADDGVSGTAVVKVPRPGRQRTNSDVTFAHEARILARLPAAGIANACRLLARARAGDGYYLFTTHVPGEHPDPSIHTLDGRQLEAILDSLHLMDRQGLMHYDLKPANVLLDGNRPGFIDFEFARFERLLAAYAPATADYCEDFNVSPNPHFPSRTNVANFEFRTLHRYLAGLSEAQSAAGADVFFHHYLRAKSRQHEASAEFLADLQATAAEPIAASGGIAVSETRRRLGIAAAYENRLATLLEDASTPVTTLERSLIAFRCDVFEGRREDARRLWKEVFERYGHGGTGSNALPADYLGAISTTFDLVWRSRLRECRGRN